jgi:hypothetical protein
MLHYDANKATDEGRRSCRGLLPVIFSAFAWNNLEEPCNFVKVIKFLSEM